ncbi:MAG: NHLP bacteriocin system secretion protein [Vicinamibacterales bacterium]
MSDNPLFRKSALEKLASPERLDVLMEVTAPRAWVALGTIGAVLLLSLVWAIFYSVPERIDGQGLLIRGGSLREVRAGGDGVLTKLDIRLNGMVEPDQVVGELEQASAEDQVRTAQAKLDEAQRESEAGSAEDRATIAQNNATVAGYQTQIDSTQAQLGSLEADLASRRELLAKGLITAPRVQALEQQVLGLRGTVANLRGQINSIRASNAAVQQRIRARQSSVEMAQLETKRATSTAEQTTQVKATVAGRVVELKKAVGDRVSYGEVIATIEPPSTTLEVIAYVDSATGKRVRVGMEAQISPSTVRREEYGFLKGKVTTVGDYPVTPEGVMAVVANQTLAKELIGSATKIEVRVELQPNPSAPSGYLWSSSSGPPFKIDSGTRLVSSFVVDRKPPIAYVLPMIRSSLGGG